MCLIKYKVINKKKEIKKAEYYSLKKYYSSVKLNYIKHPIFYKSA
jgi:hypothetical protein